MNILIIEDEEPIVDVLKIIVRNLADKIIIARNMQEALAALTTESDISIITMDLGLPDSGIQESIAKINKIREAKPDALVVVVTGSDIPGLEEEVIKGGADGFVLKQSNQFTPQGFLELLRGIAAKHIEKPQDFRKSVATLECVAKKIQELSSNR